LISYPVKLGNLQLTTMTNRMPPSPGTMSFGDESETAERRSSRMTSRAARHVS
jgi:hypothetical protein